MTYYTFMCRPKSKVYWVYGIEIDFDVIKRINDSLSFFDPPSVIDDSPFGANIFADERPGEDETERVMDRVTEYLRREYDCIGPMLAWNPDSPTKERAYVLAIHAHEAPKKSHERRMTLNRVQRVRRELVPEAREAKWYFSCEASVFKAEVDWDSRPKQFIRFHS
jgi:hypothetical protein